MIPTNGDRHVILAMAVFCVLAQSAGLARVDKNLDQGRNQEFHGNVVILLAWRPMGPAVLFATILDVRCAVPEHI